MPFSSKTFAQLLAVAQAGDHSAFGQLLDIYGRKLYDQARSLIGRRMRSLIDPADLIQATRIQLWNGMRKGKFQVDSPEQFLGLARTILRRHAAYVYRTLKRELDASSGEVRIDADIKCGTLLAAHAVQMLAGDIDLHEIVHLVLADLDDTDRELIRLRVLGHTTAHAAQVLKLPAGSLRVRLGRLRRRLQKCDALECVFAW